MPAVFDLAPLINRLVLVLSNVCIMAFFREWRWLRIGTPLRQRCRWSSPNGRRAWPHNRSQSHRRRPRRVQRCQTQSYDCLPRQPSCAAVLGHWERAGDCSGLLRQRALRGKWIPEEQRKMFLMKLISNRYSFTELINLDLNLKVACVCIWLTLDSVTPRTSPISFKLRSSS